MTDAEFKRMMLPETPKAGPIIWSRVALRVAAIFGLIAFWAAVGYATITALS